MFCDLNTHLMSVYSVTKTSSTNGSYSDARTLKYSNKQCRLEKQSGTEVEKNDSNKYYAGWIIFCDPLTIVETDIIVISSSEYIIRYIEECYDDSELHHLEISVEKVL